MLPVCDYLAERIRRCLPHNDPQALIGAVGNVRWDTAKDGTLKSTKKTIDVSDIDGKKYRITIAEL